MGTAAATLGRELCSPHTPPYLLVIYAQARRCPHSRLAVAGILTVILHLWLAQAAAQGTNPLSPVRAGEAVLGLNTVPKSTLTCPSALRQRHGDSTGNRVPS